MSGEYRFRGRTLYWAEDGKVDIAGRIGDSWWTRRWYVGLVRDSMMIPAGSERMKGIVKQVFGSTNKVI